jgi:hypothetical protein
MGRLTSPMELVIIIGSRTTRSVEINLIDWNYILSPRKKTKFLRQNNNEINKKYLNA